MNTRIKTLIAATAVVLIPAASASAHHPNSGLEPGDEVPRSVERALGGDVEVADDGLYSVDVGSGPDLLTHGPDTEEQIEAAEAAAGQSAAFGPGSPERAPECTLARQESERFQMVIYARPASSPSKYDESKPSIRTQMRRMNWVLNRDSLASGGPDGRLPGRRATSRCRSRRSSSATVTNGSTYAEIVAAAKAAGWSTTAPTTRSSSTKDPTGQACGVGNISNDDSLSAGNRNNNPDIAGATGDYGVTYRSCWQGSTAMHENGHNSGAVQNNGSARDRPGRLALLGRAGRHVLLARRRHHHQEGVEFLCNDREYFDCGYDDYFDSNPEAGEYLATHWNMGSPLNKMIRFGGVGGATPTADFTHSCVETTCQFQNTSTDDLGIHETQWSFGYGTGSSQLNPNHTFPGPGTYQVTLNVRDGHQSWDDVTKPVTVTEGRQLLTSATPFSDTGGMRDTFKRYTIKVPAGADELEVEIDGPDCRFSPVRSASRTWTCT